MALGDPLGRDGLDTAVKYANLTSIYHGYAARSRRNGTMNRRQMTMRFFPTTRFQAPVYQPNPDRSVNTARWVRVGTRTGAVRLDIDIEALAAMLGPRALRNQSQRAHLAGGAIVARAIHTVYETLTPREFTTRRI